MHATSALATQAYSKQRLCSALHSFCATRPSSTATDFPLQFICSCTVKHCQESPLLIFNSNLRDSSRAHTLILTTSGCDDRRSALSREYIVADSSLSLRALSKQRKMRQTSRLSKSSFAKLRSRRRIRLNAFAHSTLAFARKFEQKHFIWKALFSWQDNADFDSILAELDGLQRDISFAMLAEVKEHTTRTTEAAVSILTSELRRLFANAHKTDMLFDKHLLVERHLTDVLPPLTESDVVAIRGNIAASRDHVQRDESSAQISPEIVALCDDLVGNVLPQLETQLIAARETDGVAGEMARLAIEKEGLATGDAMSVRSRQMKHVCADGSVYEGEWENDTPNGHGKMVYANGDMYEGEWIDGKCNGHGKLVYADDGAIYEGDFKDDKCSGHGKNVSTNGDIYEGECKDNEFNGHGKMVYADGAAYEGEFKDGKYNGHGKKVWADGDMFEGEFKNGDKNGHGRYVFGTGGEWKGQIYEGEWKDNKSNGHGKMVYADGAVYVGEWKDDKRNGHGRCSFPDGSAYVGEWKDDYRNGYGKLVCDNGEIYEGEWKDGKYNGHGRYTWPDGAVYVGEWKDDASNGHGKQVCADGSIYEGEWKDNEFMG